MWMMEIAGKHTGTIIRLMFESQELANIERDKLSSYLGKDLYELKKNGSVGCVTLIDKHGTLDIDPLEIRAIRCYNTITWNEDSIAGEKHIVDIREKNNVDVSKLMK